ncbi:MAG TPA: glycosyltransferase family 39 protein, partial [Flavobacteriales bacterium]|nr:glycosyltransferase family 39 protein [Flavobacteriales bacterium]
MTWRERVAESAQQCVPGGMQERIALGILLVLALVLRCWGFPHIPYTHDEISALVRVDFPTLGDAISKGVWNIDTHPPGTHALLWCWTHVFGSSEGAVKLPFILMSVAALFLLYRFAHAWAGAGTAVIVTALLATLQYTVMYGQIARPYAMGLFTTALLADNMTRYLG